jgi:hypothetical protein
MGRRIESKVNTGKMVYPIWKITKGEKGGLGEWLVSASA